MSTARVVLNIEVQASWIQELRLWFREFVEDGPALQYVMQRVMTSGILVAVRRRFLARVSRAQMLQFRRSAATSDLNVLQLAAKRTALLKAQRAQAAAMERGNAAGLTAAQDRIDEILASMQSSRGQSGAENAAGYSKQMTLAAIGAGLFRQRQAQVLFLMTQEPVLTRGRGGIAVHAGNISRLNQIKTPSATRWLQKVDTPSKLSIFWRHLEWGTGRGRKSDPTNNPYTPGTGSQVVVSSAQGRAARKSPERTVGWYYGALGVYGSEFMSFLYTDTGGKPRKEYTEAAQKALEQAMEEILPNLST